MNKIIIFKEILNTFLKMNKIYIIYKSYHFHTFHNLLFYYYTLHIKNSNNLKINLKY